MAMEELKFKGGNPGAVQYGNFINYYQFHPPENRLSLFPIEIISRNSNTAFCGLDLGCNAGDLTIAFYNLLKEKFDLCDILGIDIDPTLIERANEKNKNLTFYCLDFMNENQRSSITDFLKRKQIDQFDAVFCFSITMWIHLNYGDDGLRIFLQEICKLGKIIVIEPQPWKCYKSAVKRMKLSNSNFPLFNTLQIRQSVEEEIENFILEKCHFIKIHESARTAWGRKLLIFKRP